MRQIKHGPWIALNRACLDGQDGGPWLLSMENEGEPRRVRVLDEFTDRDTAMEMFALCSEWLGSGDLTQAMIANTEDAIIDSWQDYSLIDHAFAAREDAAQLEALPTFGMF